LLRFKEGRDIFRATYSRLETKCKTECDLVNPIVSKLKTLQSQISNVEKTIFTDSNDKETKSFIEKMKDTMYAAEFEEKMLGMIREVQCNVLETLNKQLCVNDYPLDKVAITKCYTKVESVWSKPVCVDIYLKTHMTVMKMITMFDNIYTTYRRAYKTACTTKITQMLRRRSKLIDSKEELINACAYKSFESNPYYENSEHYENQKKEYFKELEENDKEYRKCYDNKDEQEHCQDESEKKTCRD